MEEWVSEHAKGVGLGRGMNGERRVMRGGGRRSTDREPQRGWMPAGVIALSVAVTDWIVKWWVAQTLPLQGFRVLWDERIALLHVRNDAMVLGLYGELPLQSRQAIAAMCAVLGAMLVLEVTSRGHRLPPHRRKWAWIFVGLASGGMLGNLGERVVHWGVTDYLSFRWNDLWLPPGNIADLAIFVSIPLAMLVIYFEMEARMQRSQGESAPVDGTLVPEPVRSD
jgi:lipoprotein signal peptidase